MSADRDAKSPATNELLLREVPLLARLDTDELRALASRGRVRSYKAGAVIFREGDPGDSLHIVVEGRIRVSVVSASGEDVTFTLVQPGECCGDIALLDGMPRSATASAFGPTKTLVVTRDDFRTWISERPRAALALLEAMSLRTRRLSNTVADLVFLDLRHRLAKALLTLAAGELASLGRQPESGGTRSVRVTQENLASMLGVSRQSVNKELQAFVAEGFVELGRGSVSIKQPEALSTLV